MDATPTIKGDFPKTDPEHDELGRKQFCRKLARMLARGHSSGSTVVAIYGDWGVGKTTAKNFAVHFLRKEHGIEPIEFESWGWSGRDRIIEALFTRIEASAGIREMPKTKRWIESVHRALGFSLPFIDATKFVWPTVGTVLSLGFVWLSSTYALEREWIQFGVLALVGLSGTAVAGRKLTQAIKDYNAEVREGRIASLDEVREDLVAELASRGKSLVVVIDDIDRLEPAEIRQVVQVVKAVANLPHVVFLLLFQRDVVTRALDSVAGEGKGQEFLEKIVQVAFHVPEPPTGCVMAMLEKSLVAWKKDPQFSRHWDEERWRKQSRPTIEGYFRNARDVVRFTSALSVYIDQHIHQGYLEVNPVDLIALEVLRIFEPTLFEKLSAVPLIGPSLLAEMLTSTSKESKERRRLDVERLTRLIPDEERATGTALLHALFPQLSEHYDGSPEKMDRFDAELRVCHPLHYGKYFDLNLLKDRASDQDFQLLLDAATDVSLLRRQFQRIIDLGLVNDVIARFAIHLEKQNSCASAVFAHVLPEVGENLPDRYDNDEAAGIKEQAVALTLQALRQLPTDQARFDLWSDVLKQSSGLDIAVDVTSALKALVEKNDPINRPIITADQATTLVQLMLARIKADAQNGRLVSRPWFLRHIHFWASSTSPNEVKAWAATYVTDRQTALRILAAWLQNIVSYGNTVRRIPVLDGEGLDRMVGFDLLGSNLSADISDKPASAEEEIALALYERAKVFKAADKPFNRVTPEGSEY